MNALLTQTDLKPQRSLNHKMGDAGTMKDRSQTDPSDYNEHHNIFAQQGLPTDEASWIERAAAVSRILASDVTERDLAQAVPFAEISLLKSAGLTKLLGSNEHGGGGQPWDVAYKVIREVAKGDGSLGMLLGYHLLWSWTANVVGTDEQRDRWQKVIIGNNYFIGGMYHMLDLLV